MFPTQCKVTRSALKKEIVPFATMWMDLKGIMLSEKGQTEKGRYRMISLRTANKNQAPRHGEQTDGSQRWRQGEGGG